MQLDEDRAPLGRLVQQVSRLRNAEAAGAAYRGPPDPRRRETIRELTRAYRQSLADQKAVDFDGLLIRALELLDASENAPLFRRPPGAVRAGGRVPRTPAPTQHRLLLRLAPHRDVFAVGDDDQSIYSFRGADFRNILRFREDFPGARVFRLEDNYRSTAAILEAANAVIRRNRRRAGKTLRALGGAGERVRLRHHETDLAEAQGVALEIAGQGNGRGSTAVLVRTRAQTRPFEEAFAAHRIPHVIVGGLRFYERREVLDALASLRLALNAADDSAFRRALAAIPRGVGPQSLRRIEERAAVLGTPLLEAAQRIASEGDFRGSVLRGLRSFLEGAAAVERAARQGPQAAVLSAIEDTGLGAFLEANDRERFENLVSLRAAALEFERVNPGEPAPVFLDQVSLLSAEDLVPDEAGEAGAPPVLVMTVHAAKGLEFDQVFLGGLWDGLFPHALSLDSESGLEEERRLLHVGMTRAKKAPAALGGARRRPLRPHRERPVPLPRRDSAVPRYRNRRARHSREAAVLRRSLPEGTDGPPPEIRHRPRRVRGPGRKAPVGAVPVPTDAGGWSSNTPASNGSTLSRPWIKQGEHRDRRGAPVDKARIGRHAGRIPTDSQRRAKRSAGMSSPAECRPTLSTGCQLPFPAPFRIRGVRAPG